MMQPSDALFVGSSELAALMRSTDWGRTGVGPPEHWPQSVRAIVRLMLTSRYAMWMGWGPDLTFFYNAEMLAAALAAAGHRTALAEDGPAALARAASFRPDVTLLDIGLR